MWVHDLVRGGSTRLTQERAAYVIWTPDGEYVTFSQGGNLYRRVADGSRPAERLTTSENDESPSSWSPDGTTLAFIHDVPNDGRNPDIWMLPMDGERIPRPFVESPVHLRYPEFSPDGRWLAYTLNESGREEVYVQPYPGPGRRYQISTAGGGEPAWSADGRQLYYRGVVEPGGARPVMAADITTEPDFVASRPRVLFGGWPGQSLTISGYDVAPDGRFLTVATAEWTAELLDRPLVAPAPRTHLRVVAHWLEELKARVPVN